MTPARFSAIGDQLFGPSWKGRMADALNNGYRTILRWTEAGATIPEGVADDLARLCRGHAAKLIKTAEELEARK